MRPTLTYVYHQESVFMQLVNSNYKSIFHKCSLACSFALENLSIHMQTHILDPNHFPFFSDFCNSITEFRERERERERDPRPSVSLDRATQRDKFQDLKRMVHSTMLCCYSPSVIKEHKLLFQAIQCQKKQHLVYCSPVPGLFVLKFKDRQVVWTLAWHKGQLTCQSQMITSPFL